jgi:hypothetical protein
MTSPPGRRAAGAPSCSDALEATRHTLPSRSDLIHFAARLIGARGIPFCRRPSAEFGRSRRYAGCLRCDVSDTPPAKLCRKSSNCGRRVGGGLQIAAEGVVAIGVAASLFQVRHADRASRPRLKKAEGESLGSPSTRERLWRSWDRAKSIGPCDGSAALFANEKSCVNT